MVCTGLAYWEKWGTKESHKDIYLSGYWSTSPKIVLALLAMVMERKISFDAN